MKFHTKISNSLRMKDFALILSTLKNLDEKMCIKIDSDKISMFVQQNNKTGAMFSFDICQNFFDSFTMSGVDSDDADGNNIYLEATTSNMFAAFSSLNKNTSVIKEVKLNLLRSKNDFPCLSVQIFFASENTANLVDVINEVPVIIIPRLQWISYQIPDDFSICSKLPKLNLMQKYLDSHKNISGKISLQFNLNGCFSMNAETDCTAVCTSFEFIKCHAAGTSNESNREQNAVIIVDSKKFAFILHCIQFHSVQLKCAVKSPNGPFKLFFKVGEYVEANCFNFVLYSEDD